MSSATGRVVLLTLAGIAAGLLTWFFSDLSGLIRLPDTGGALTARENLQQALVCTVFGALIGALLGVADGLASGTRGQWPKIVGIGLLVGAVAGFVGIQFGMAFYGFLHTESVTNPFSFLRNVLARALGWAFIGALAGTADGIRKWSGRVLRNGMIGGFIGGLFGGIAFETSVYVLVGLRSPAVVSRLLGFVITGAMIGFFIALVQQLLKEAWVRVVVGRNEFKEILVEKAETKIGRSELSDVPLYGDTHVAKTHALLLAGDGGKFVLRDVSGMPGGLVVNGEPVQGERPVRDGDQIVIGSKTLVFHERYTRQRTAPAPKDVAAPRPHPAASSGLPSLNDLPGAGAAAPVPASGAAMASNYSPGIAGGGAGAFSGASPGSRLVAVAGPHAGAAFALAAGAVIGRDPGADIALPHDTQASRRHARIVQEALSFAIEDAGSTNGTYVNGQRVTRQTLLPGDTVVVGSTSLRLE